MATSRFGRVTGRFAHRHCAHPVGRLCVITLRIQHKTTYRYQGFGARIVSGYLFVADAATIGSGDAGSTHAWAEVYVPGAGWVTFDPTNRNVGGFNLIPVAVARDIRLIMPVTGSFNGDSDALLGMWVEVRVTAAAQDEPYQ